MPQPTPPTRPQQDPPKSGSPTPSPNRMDVPGGKKPWLSAPGDAWDSLSASGGAPETASGRGVKPGMPPVPQVDDELELSGAGRLLARHADRSTDTEFFSP